MEKKKSKKEEKSGLWKVNFKVTISIQGSSPYMDAYTVGKDGDICHSSKQ